MKKIIVSAMALFAFASTTMKAQDLVLPEGMIRLTPEGVEASSFMSFINPMAPGSENPKTGKYYFAGKTEEHGNELWVTDGTVEGTKMVIDINPGSADSNPSSLCWLDGKLYFAAETLEHGKELWVSDGTPEGTRMVTDIYPGTVSSNPGNFVRLNGKILFTAMDEESEFLPVIDPATPEKWVWITDGTAEGTVRITDNPMNSYFEVVGDKAFFAGVDLVNNETLWITDGTRAGTKVLKNINNRPTPDGTFETATAAIGALRNVNDKWVVFRAETVKEQVGGDKDYGSEIWWSDGTPEGTKWLGYDFAKGEANGLPLATELASPYAVGDTLFFRANDGIHGVEPCIWDLSKPIIEDQNPRLIFDINHWSGNASLPSWPSEYIVYQDHLLMQANGGYYMPEDPSQYASGYSLWLSPINKLDTCIYQRQFWGTDIAPGSTQDGCGRFTKVGDKLFFTAQDENNNTELWKLDNISNPPTKVVDLPGNGTPSSLINIDNYLFFASTSLKALFKYDFGQGGSTGIGTATAEETPITISVKEGLMEIKCDISVGSVRIYDASGRLVKSAFNANALYVQGLSGFYIAKIQLEDKSVVNYKFILK